LRASGFRSERETEKNKRMTDSDTAIILREPGENGTQHAREYSAGFTVPGGIGESEALLSFRHATIRLSETWFEGMHIQEMTIEGSGRCTLEVETVTPFYVMKVCLSGECGCRHGTGGDDLSLKELQSAFRHVPACVATYSFCCMSRVIWIRLTERCFTRLTAGSHELTGNGTMACAAPGAKAILQAISGCRYAAGMKRIFIESKVLELLVLILDRMNARGDTCCLKQHDLDKIEYARQLVGQNLREPYSLLDLARRAGLNDFKLKKGFKQLTGSTVFTYITDLRMDKAMRMLRDEKKPVSIVSFEVGFKNPHHFTVAFKKKFGILPREAGK
jgi:AraC-like DNA-binding protein